MRISRIGIVACVLLGIAVARGGFALVPNDPFFARQWYLERIGAPAAWDTITASQTVVAVLDVGVDTDHPDLAGALWTNPDEVAGNGRDDDGNGYIDDVHGWDFVDHDPIPMPQYDVANGDPRDLHHGTMVAGIIAARGNNGEGIAGIDWGARIMPLRVLHGDGSGEVETVLAAFRYAVAKGATIINLSFVGDERSPEFDAEIAAATIRGVLVIAAGGNEARNGRGNLDEFPVYPICSGDRGADVIGVAATTARDEQAPFSSYGSCVDIAAPGEQMVGALLHDPDHTLVPVGGRIGATTFSSSYGGPFSGTSFAAPVIAGAASLVRGAYPGITPGAIIALLRNSVDPIANLSSATAGKFGAGRVNLARAIGEARIRATQVPSAGTTTIAVSTPLAAVGELVTVRITARSANGSLLAGRLVTLTTTNAAATIAPASVTTDGQGVASFTVTARAAGIVPLVVAVDGIPSGSAQAVFAAATSGVVGAGTLVRGSTATVYLIASDGKRYAFPDLQTFRSWYVDTNGVQRVPDAVLAAFPLGGLVTIRPGTFLVKIQTDPKVYAVEPPMPGSGQASGVLRWVPDEATAVLLFGPAWAARIVDVPDAFFPTYRLGMAITGGMQPSGTLLEDTGDGMRYLIVNGSRRRVDSTLAFLKNGYQWRDVVRGTTVAYTNGTPITDREPALALPVP